VAEIAVNALRFPVVDWGQATTRRRTRTFVTDQMWSIPVHRITLVGAEQVRQNLAACSPVAPERRAYFAQSPSRPEGSWRAALFSSR